MACGVGALERPAEAGVPRRMEARRSRVTLRSRGVRRDRRPEGVSALKARRLGVLEGVWDGITEAALRGGELGGLEFIVGGVAT